MVVESYKMKQFEFSQTYNFFWDQFEKANLFMEAMITTVITTVEAMMASMITTVVAAMVEVVAVMNGMANPMTTPTAGLGFATQRDAKEGDGGEHQACFQQGMHFDLL